MGFKHLFGCNDTAIIVRSNYQKVINDLKCLFGEYYKESCEPSLTLNFYVDLTPTEYQIEDCEDGDPMLNQIKSDSQNINIYFSEYNEYKKKFAQRIFTNTFTRIFQKKGYIIIHGACVQKGNDVVLIVGHKTSGKTTALINFIKNGYEFISNDKVSIKKENGALIVCGIPFSMGIFQSDFQNRDDYLHEYTAEKGKIFLNINEVSTFFNTEISTRNILSRIVFTEFQLSGPEIIEKVDDIFVMINENILINAVSEQKQYINDFIKVDHSSIPSSFFQTVSACRIRQNKCTGDKLVMKVINSRAYSDEQSSVDYIDAKQ